MTRELLCETTQNGFTVRTYQETVTDDERIARDKDAVRKLKRILSDVSTKDKSGGNLTSDS